jgi:PAS domain S-box-containing protein
MDNLEKVTQRAALKAEVLAKFIDAIPVSFIVTDDTGVIYLVNRQAELLFGYDQTEIIGSHVELLVPEALREGHVKHRASFVDEPHSRGMGGRRQLSARKKNGEEFQADISLGPLVTTEGLYVVVVIIRHREKDPNA